MELTCLIFNIVIFIVHKIKTFFIHCHCWWENLTKALILEKLRKISCVSFFMLSNKFFILVAYKIVIILRYLLNKKNHQYQIFMPKNNIEIITLKCFWRHNDIHGLSSVKKNIEAIEWLSRFLINFPFINYWWGLIFTCQIECLCWMFTN